MVMLMLMVMVMFNVVGSVKFNAIVICIVNVKCL